MSTGIAKRDAAPLPDVVEQVLVHGDLSKLSTSERLKYYIAVCEASNLDPRGRPFEYISLQGKLVLYARKQCAEQLNGMHGISHTVEKIETDEKAGIVEVTVRATMGSRSTMDIGIVPIVGLKGADLANARMKAVTKAKRRCTLSLCGLGSVIDETELDTVAVRECTETGGLKAIDNQSGHAKGQYASDEDAKKWLARAEEFLERRNSKWRDHWFAQFKGDVPSDVHDPCNIFQLDAHLTKWAIEVGHLERGSTDEQGLKRHQMGKLTGILFLKRGKAIQTALVEECNRYFDEQERVQLQKIAKKYPSMDEEAAEEATDDDMDGIDDGFPKGGEA